jgi:hypothetical protein
MDMVALVMETCLESDEVMIRKIPSPHERRMTGLELDKMAYDFYRLTT